MNTADVTAVLRVLRTISRHTRETPVTGETVELATGVDSRTVAELVGLAASEGVPVASCSGGYFAWRSPAERQEYIEREQKRLRSLGRKIAAVKRAERDSFSLFEQDAA